MSANWTSVDTAGELSTDGSKNFGYNVDQSILAGDTGLQTTYNCAITT